MEQEINIETIKERSVRGIVVLTSRTFLVQIIGAVSLFIIFQYLDPSAYGVFTLVSAFVNFLVYFSDIGLAASLIQKNEKPTEVDLKTTFLVQQSLVFVLVTLLFLLTPFLMAKYSLDIHGRNLIYALGLSLIMSSFKSIPSVLLERKLEFVKLVFPQIIEQIVFNIVAIVLVIKGFGLDSFSYAVLIRGVIGVSLIYYFQPWKIGVAFSKDTLKGLFKFGIPYQINTFLATLKDDGLTIVLGGIIGSSGIGVLSFAQKISRLPLTFFMDTVTRVTFPAFSRLQNEKEHLERSVTRSIFFICFLVFPSLVGIIILSPLLIKVVPRYNQWEPALLPIVFISINFAFAAATTQLTNLLNAIGKIKITFYLMIMWTVLTWVFIPFLSIKYGVVGTSIGYSLVGASSIIAVIIAKKYVNFSITDSILKPLIGSIVMGIVLLLVRGFVDVSINSMIMLSVVGVVVYLSSMMGIVGLSLVEDIKRSVNTLRNKNTAN